MKKNPEIGQVVYIKQDLIEHACGDHPAYGLAYRGDAVIVKKLAFKENNFLVAHLNVKSDNCFRVSRDEIMLDDPLITVLEQRAYLKRTNYKSLDERYYED